MWRAWFTNSGPQTRHHKVLEDAGVLEAGFFYDKQAFLISSLVDEEVSHTPPLLFGNSR